MRVPFLNHFDLHMQEIVRGAGVALILRITGAGFGFLFNVLLARLLGAEGAGLYYLAFTATAVAVVIGRLGLDNALLRFTAAHAAFGEWNTVRSLYRRGIGIASLSSGLVAVIVMIFAPYLSQKVFSDPDLTVPLRWMALSIIPVSLLHLHGELLKGLKRTRDAMLVQGTGLPVLGVLLLLIVGSDWEVLGAVFAYTLSSFIVLLTAVWLWRRSIPPPTRDQGGPFSGRLLMSTSLPLLLVASMDLVLTWTDTVMLGAFGAPADVGVYGVAMRTAMLTSFVLIAVNSIAAPKFAALFRQGDMRTLGAVARGSARLAIIVAAPILLAFMLVSGRVLQIFGEGFESGAFALTVLSMGQFVNVAMGSVGYLLMMSGNEKLMRNNVVAAATLNIVLNLLLVPRYGINGAAVATAISLAMMNVVAAFLVYWKLRVVTIPIRIR